MSCKSVSHYVAGYRPREIEVSTGQDGAIEIRQPVLSHSLRYFWYLGQVAANADVVKIENDDRLGQRHVDLHFVVQVCGHPRRPHCDSAVAIGVIKFRLL